MSLYLKSVIMHPCSYVSHHHEDKGDGHEDVGESHDALVS